MMFLNAFQAFLSTTFIEYLINSFILGEYSNFKKKRIVKKLDVIAQNQNHFRNQEVEIVQKLSILWKQRNQCRPV
jgi:uncharacterized membrane protein